MRLLVMALAVGAAALGCSDDERPPPPGLADRPSPPDCGHVVEQCAGDADPTACEAAQLESCATAYFYAGYSETLLPSCNAGEPILPIRQTVSTPLFRGVDIADADVAVQTRALQRYFEPHELWFTTTALSSPFGMRYAMQGSERELNAALVEAGIPLDRELTAEENELALEVTGQVIFGGLRGFLSEHAQGIIDRVNVAVIYDIVDPDLEPLLDIQGEVVGLGLSPALLERISEDEQSQSIYQLLGLGSEFKPTLLVGHRTIVRLLRYPDAVIAHEMGHALGLPHVDISGNLMQQVADPHCRGTLLSEQIELMGPFQSRLGGEPCGLLDIRALHRRVVQNLLRRARLGVGAP